MHRPLRRSQALLPLLIAAGLAFVALRPAYGQDTTQTAPTKSATEAEASIEKEGSHASQDFASVLKARGQFATLVEALEQTGLAETLRKSKEPLTLFAPTDEAFAALPAGTLDSLTTEQWTSLLRNHLVRGAMPAEEAVAAETLSSIQGGTLQVARTSDAVTVNGSPVTEADIEAGNGIIHVTSEVLHSEGSPASQSGSMKGEDMHP